MTILTATGALFVVLAFEAGWTLAHPAELRAELGGDYTIYMEAARRWLAGGSFYAPYQFAGPYELVQPAVLYPPSILLLLVPFAVLPPIISAPLWWGIPLALTVAAIVAHRPARWAWPLMLLGLAWGQTGAILVNGTPTLWILAFVALATHRRWAGALVLLKPSVFPFAFIGIRSRRWWAVALALAVVSLALLPLWLHWLTVLRNGTGPRAGLFYSLIDVPLLAVPVVAWLGRQAKPRGEPGEMVS